MRRAPILVAVALAGLLLAACGDDTSSSGSADTTAAPETSAAATTAAATTAAATSAAATSAAPDTTVEDTEPVTLRLGYFPNVTHAPALVGIGEGVFEENLGDNVTLETTAFNAGPAAVEALFAEALDATFIGPNPAINAFAKSNGEAIRIVSGSTSGGAFLVVRPEITSAADLKGKKLATPQLGGTQDVALRAWLADNGLKTDAQGGGDVSILPQENAQTLEAFVQGTIDGAWVPEPWATRLVQEGGAKVLVDERDLWPDGQWVTTHLIVRTDYLEDHPQVIRDLIAGLVKSVDLANDDPTGSQKVVNDQIEAVTGKRVKDAVLASSWENLQFTVDPVASSLQQVADNATKVGLLDKVDLKGIYDLTLLNEVLKADGRQPVAEP